MICVSVPILDSRIFELESAFCVFFGGVESLAVGFLSLFWLSFPKILGFAVVLVGLFVDFRVELDLWFAVALKSTKSPL